MKLLLIALALSPASAFALDIQGAYYVPYKTFSEPGEYQPEALSLFHSNGTFEVHTVHDGKREIAKGTYLLKGNEVTLTKTGYEAVCPNVVNENESEMKADVRLTDASLELSIEGETISLPKATETEKQKVLALPACGK